MSKSIKALPVVKKGEDLETWLGRAVPALVEQAELDEAAATELATQAWNKVNGEEDATAEEDPDAEADPEAELDADADPDAELDTEDAAEDEMDPTVEVDPDEELDPEAEADEPFGAEADAPTSTAFGEPAAAAKPAVAAAPAQVTVPAPAAVKPMAPAAMTQVPVPGQTPTGPQNGQTPGMDWNDPNSWGSGLDGSGVAPIAQEPVNQDGRRDPLALDPIEDAAQVLENWFVANIAAYASSLAATLMDTSRLNEEEGQLLNKSVAKILEDLAGRAQKAATIGSYFEARIHQDFTNLADTLRGDGHLTREERIALSSCIGDALHAFNEAVATKLSPATQKRSPWADVELPNTTGDQFQFLTPLPDFSMGQAPVSKTVATKIPAQVKQRDESRKGLDVWASLHGLEGPNAVKSAKLSIPDPEWMTIKSLGKSRVGSYLCLWGDPNHRDISGEWFSPRTDELTAIFDSVGRVPAIYHHAMDGAMKSMVIGVVDTMEKDDVGLWIEAQIQRHTEYQKFIAPLVDRKVLGWSSGTLPMARQVNKSTGEITRWPIVEASMTPQPAEMRMAWQWPVQNIKAAYMKAGLKLPAGLLDQLTGKSGNPELQREIELELERIELLGLEL